MCLFLNFPLIFVLPLYFMLLQSAWHLSPVRSKWCFSYTKLSAAGFSSSRGGRGWKSNLRALFSCLYEWEDEVWRGRSTVILHSLIIKWYLKEQRKHIVVNIEIICQSCKFVGFVNRIWEKESKARFNETKLVTRLNFSMYLIVTCQSNGSLEGAFFYYS